MGHNYIVKIDASHKNWISKKSVMDNVPIYKIFEQDMYPYYQNNFKGTLIKKVMPSGNTRYITLSGNMKKTLNLEAIEKQTNNISLVNFVFEFYLQNNM